MDVPLQLLLEITKPCCLVAGRAADPVDGARVALLQRLHAQVGRLELRHPHVGGRHSR